MDADLYGQEAASSAARITAWASLSDIRKFQQIGGPSVTVWRELRRLDTEGVDKAQFKKNNQSCRRRRLGPIYRANARCGLSEKRPAFEAFDGRDSRRKRV